MLRLRRIVSDMLFLSQADACSLQIVGADMYLDDAVAEASRAAQTLARATVVGSGELLHQSPLSAATLRENVTSPNGTTYAALQVLGGENGLTELMRRATAAAARRAKELAG